jgi:hypothetical protein
MSITVCGGLLYGFRVEREDFFKPAGERHICPHDSEHDIMRDGDVCKYCPECGTATEFKRFEEPTPQFAEYIKQQNEEASIPDDPEDFWLNWVDGCTPEGEVGVFDGAAMQYGSSPDECYVFGIRMQNIEDREMGGGTQPVSLAELEMAAIKIKPMAQMLGLKLRELKLYPYVYVS